MWPKTLALLALPSVAFGFAEDLCLEVEDGATDGTVIACYDVAVCEPGEDTPACRVAAVASTAAITGQVGRSTLHTDATYYLAQALGFNPDAAYFIAAYNQASDARYIPFDQDGALIEDPADWTADINGFNRLSMPTGGWILHMVPNATRHGDGSGLYPDLDDAHTEGVVISLRNWVFEDGPACSASLTSRQDSVYFGGPTCFDDGAEPLTRPSLFGTQTILERADPRGVPFSVYLGEQVVHYDSDANGDMTNVLFAADFDAYIGSGEFGAMDDGSPVPPELAKVGIYLHSLQDRISHYECGDVSTISLPSRGSRFLARYDLDECAADIHALRHYYEVGYEEMPPQTVSALDYTVNELVEFVDHLLEADPALAEEVLWLEAPMADSDVTAIHDLLVGSTGTDGFESGMVTYALTQATGADRLTEMHEGLEAVGYVPMRGHGSTR